MAAASSGKQRQAAASSGKQRQAAASSGKQRQAAAYSSRLHPHGCSREGIAHRLARQGLNQGLLLAHLLGSGLGSAVVQPALAILVMGLLPSTAAAQSSVTTISYECKSRLEFGDSCLIFVNFDRRRISVTGSPRLRLMIGDKTRYAEMVSLITFVYTVQPDDLDTNGISIPANPIDLNGGTIKDSDSGVDVNLSHPGLSDESGPTVDGSKGEGLIYSSVPNTLAVGTTITPLTATPVNFAEGATFTYEVTAGTLPPGLSLDTSTGAITGTPTTVSATVTYVTITVTAGTGMDPSTATRWMSFPAVSGPLVFDPTALMVNEGSSGTYTVKLASQPSASVTVAVTGAVGEVTMNPTSLTFNSTTWNTAQTVTVTAGQDDDANDDSATLVHTTTGGDYAGVTDSVAVTVDDDDDQSLTYSAAPTTLMVGTPITALTATATNFTGTPSYSVTTGSLPAGLRISASTGEITGTPTAASTSTTTVTVTTAGTGTDTQTATANITFPAILANQVPTVRTPIPDQTATVGTAFEYIFPAGTFSDGDSDSLTYTATRWNDRALPTWLTFTASERKFAGTPQSSDTTDSLGVKVTASDGMGGSVSNTFYIEVLTDAAFSVTGPATVAEDAGTATYTVTLSAQPSATVTVGYATGGRGTARAGADYRANRGTLTFTPTNWNTAQTVAVTIINDRLDDDGELFFFRLSNPGTGTVLSSRASVLTIINDTPAQAQSCTRIRGDSRTSLDSSDFENPESVTCVHIRSNDALTSIDFSGLSSLNSLDIRGNSALTSIDLSGLSSLDYLFIRSNDALTSLDLSGLSSLSNLEIRSNDALTSLDLSGLSSLSNLEIRSNAALTSLDLSGLSSLDYLDIGGNSALTSLDFSGLSGLSSLNSLDIYYNSSLRSIDFSGLSGLSSLNDLDIESNDALTSLDFSGLSGLSSLNDLYIFDNDALTSIDFSGLSGLSSLNNLYIFRNAALTSLDFSGLSSLNDLYIEQNAALTSLDFSGLSGLSSLNDLDIRFNAALTSLDFSELSGLSSLNDLYIGNNDALTSLDFSGLSGLSSLNDLDIFGNDALTSIGFSGLSGLSSLNDLRISGSNSLTSLDFSGLSGLSSLNNLYISFNAEFPSALTSLDFSGLSSLNDLRISGSNSLTSLDFSGLSSLNDLRISRNNMLNSIDFSCITELSSMNVVASPLQTITALPELQAELKSYISSIEVTFIDTPAGDMCSAEPEPEQVNQAPTITPIEDLTVTMGDDTVVPITATDPEEDPLQYSVASDNGQVAAVSPTTLTDFVSGESQVQLTTMAEGTATITITLSDGTNEATETFSVVVESVVGLQTITENDTRGVTLSTTTLRVNEGDTESYTVVLDSEPTGDVTVTIGGTDNTDITVDTDPATPDATLTFTPTNWSTPRMVTVTAADDDDAVNDPAVILTHTASGGDYESLTGPSLSVTITENDTRGVTLSTTALRVNEGETESYTVLLDSEPTGNVTVTVGGATGDVSVDTSTESDDQTTLTFTPTNWSTPRTVTVMAADDDDAVNDPAVTLTHTASGGDYESLTGPSLSVTINENDTRGVMLSTTTLTVNEEETESYTVVLNSEPTGDVTVTIGGTDNTDITVDTDPATPDDQPTLTFTPTNWSTPRTVTVVAADDDDAVNDAAVTLTHAVTGADYGSERVASVAVIIIENDAATFSVTGPATIGEGAGTATYRVSLSALPSANVTINYATADGTATAGSDYMAASDTLTFTPTNWDTAQMVAVTITDDTVDDDDETFTFTLSNPGSGAVLSASRSVSTTIMDDDVPVLTVSFAAATYSVTEGAPLSVAVSLSAIPERSVTIPLTATNGTGATSSDYSIPSSITFASTETSKTLTFSATDDAVDEDNETVTLGFGTLPPRMTAGTTSQTAVTIMDDDSRGLMLSATSLAVNENAFGTYTVALSSQPTTNVTVTVDGAIGDVSVDTDPATTGDQTTLTFTPTNWSTARMVTVTAADDDDAVNDPAVTLTHTASGGDYASLTGPSLSVTITENDSRGVMLSTTNLTMNEGDTESYTVLLDSEPTENVTVTIGGTDNTDITVDTDPATTGDQTTLTFTPTNWSTARMVTVTAADDDDAVNDPAVTLTHTASGGDYASLTGPSLSVTITENDSRGVTLSTTTNTTITITNLTVNEGDTESYTVLLDSEPTENVTVTIGGTDNTDITVDTDPATTGDQTTLTFTPTNWSTARMVTVTAADDDDSVTDTAVTLTHTASGGDYASLTGPSLSVTIIENDAASFDEVNTEILPSIINQVAENQVAIITSRSEIISSGLNSVNLSMEEMVTDVADYLFSHHQEIQANDFDWRQALSGKNFSFTLAETSTPQSSMDDGKLSSSGSGPLSFWGAIDYSSLQDKIETISLDGDTLSFNFGVDKEFTSDLVLGILLSIANSEFDLTGGFTGTYEVDLSTLNPYISWEASEDLSLWASVGYGRGQVDLTDDSTNPPVSERSDFTRFSAGGRFQLWQSETGTGLALKLDGTTARFLGADVQRSRLATELSHDFSIESGVLNTALELGLLMSSADESAAELVGRLHWRSNSGLSSSIQSRVLLGGGDRQEWGIGGALRYTAGGGEGLMMSLEPSFGISNPQLLPDLWQVTTSNPATTTAAPTARLNAKLAYGFPTTGGLLTPYTDFSFSDTTSTYGAGLRYGLSTGLDLDLKGTHKTTTMNDVENSILLELRSDL